MSGQGRRSLSPLWECSNIVWALKVRASSENGGLIRWFLLVLSGKTLLGFNHSLDTVVHVLDQVFLGAAKSPNIGDVVDMVISLCVFAVSTANLNEVLISNCFEFFLALAK